MILVQYPMNIILWDLGGGGGGGGGAFQKRVWALKSKSSYDFNVV